MRNHEINFADGLEYEKENYLKTYSPEELLNKKCGSCVRCEKRTHEYKGKKDGYHCCMKDYGIDIHPDDKACKDFWDKEYHDRCERSYSIAIERRREELWKIYSAKEPVELPIVFDGYGNIPECPICGEMPYSTKQCHWCGQRFIQDENIEEYKKPVTVKMKCISCGAEVTANISKYNGHRSYHCNNCGCSMMQ